MTQTDTQILRSGYESFAARDVDAVLAVFADDITWHVPGRSPMAADYTGHDEVVRFIQMLGERSDGTFRLEVHDILDNGDGRLVALVTENAQRNGATLNSPAVHVWRLQGGKATSFDAFMHDDYSFDEFWS